MAIRLFLQYKVNDSGKGKFLSKLIPELEALGVKVQFKEKKADIALLISRNRNKPFDKLPKCPRVIRLDGMDLTDCKKERTRYRMRTRYEINKCDAIIYQSQFSKYMYEGILKPKVEKTYVIFNGDSPENYVYSPIAKSDYKHNILLVSRWYRKVHRYYKRLLPTVDKLETYIDLNNDCCVWIAGDTGPELSSIRDNVNFLGHLSDKDLKPYMRLCDIVLHLSWFSWCDNALIESIMAGCVPIVSNQGGNAEFVKECNGVVLDLDKPIPAERMESTIPPDFDHATVFDAIDKTLEKPPRIFLPPIHIKNIAKKYYEVFKEVLDK